MSDASRVALFLITAVVIGLLGIMLANLRKHPLKRSLPSKRATFHGASSLFACWLVKPLSASGRPRRYARRNRWRPGREAGSASLPFAGPAFPFADTRKSAFCKRSHAIWQRRTNVWLRVTSPARGTKRPSNMAKLYSGFVLVTALFMALQPASGPEFEDDMFGMAARSRDRFRFNDGTRVGVGRYEF